MAKERAIRKLFLAIAIGMTFLTFNSVHSEASLKDLSDAENDANNKSIFKPEILTITGEEAKENSFFGVISRTKHLYRWSTLISRDEESLNDHLLDTARIAHMLVLIKNEKFGGDLDPGKAVILAMYHDLPEIVTDDMPTPIKYGHPMMKPIYGELEEKVSSELISKMPEEFREDFDSILNRKKEDEEYWKIVKYADTISALIKCLIEKNLGNRDFDKAFLNLEKSLIETVAPEVEYFMKTFLPAYNYTYPGI